MTLIKPIFDEIRPDRGRGETKHPLRAWLEEQEFIFVPVDDETEKNATFLGEEYKTREVGKGANLNDIRLIAYAKQ